MPSIIESTPLPPRLKLFLCSLFAARAVGNPILLGELLRVRANANFELDRASEAIADLDIAIPLLPEDWCAYVIRGGAKVGLDLMDEAICDLDKALSLKPDEPSIYLTRGFANLSVSRIDSAITDFNETLRFSHEVALAYMGRGTAYFAAEEFGRARRDLDEAVRLDPSSILPRSMRGPLRAKLGDIAGGLEDVERALKSQPKSPVFLYARATIHKYGGNYAAAIEDMSTALELQPDDPDYLNGLAWIFATATVDRCRDGARAVQLAEAAVARRESPETLDTLAAAFAEAGRFQDAIATEKRAIGQIDDGDLADVVKRRLKSHLARLEDSLPIRDDPPDPAAGRLGPWDRLV